MTAILLLATLAAQPYDVQVTPAVCARVCARAWEAEIRRTRRDFGRFPERAAELREHLQHVRSHRADFLPILRPPYQRREWGVLPFNLTVMERRGDVTVLHMQGDWQARCAVRRLPAKVSPGDNINIQLPLIYEGRYTHKGENDYSDRLIPLFRQCAIARHWLHWSGTCQPRRVVLLGR